MVFRMYKWYQITQSITYCNKGPNHVWNIDRNDKFKRFGFYVHRFIDGFSRKTIWLPVANTNKDEVEVINGTATKIRTDIGSENYYVCGIKTLFAETIMVSYLAVEAFNTVNHHQNQRI